MGVGIPGAESLASGRIKNANSTCLIGRTLRGDLEALLRREVRLANDANCFALSEASDGAGRGAEVVFGVILGTGVGGGIVVNGRSDAAPTPSPENGATIRCPCPMLTISRCPPVTAAASAASKLARRAGADARPCGRNGEPLAPPEIDSRAASGGRRLRGDAAAL